jgi:hypothetical protein
MLLRDEEVLELRRLVPPVHEHVPDRLLPLPPDQELAAGLVEPVEREAGIDERELVVGEQAYAEQLTRASCRSSSA